MSAWARRAASSCARDVRRGHRGERAASASEQARSAASSQQPLRVALHGVLQRAARRLPQPAHDAPPELLGALVLPGVGDRDRRLARLERLPSPSVDGELVELLSSSPSSCWRACSRSRCASRCRSSPLSASPALSACGGLLRGVLGVLDRLDRVLRQRPLVARPLRQLARALGELALLVARPARAACARARPRAGASGASCSSAHFSSASSLRRASSTLLLLLAARVLEPGALLEHLLRLVERAQRAAAALHRLVGARLLERVGHLLGQLARGGALARPRVAPHADGGQLAHGLAHRLGVLLRLVAQLLRAPGRSSRRRAPAPSCRSRRRGPARGARGPARPPAAPGRPRRPSPRRPRRACRGRRPTRPRPVPTLPSRAERRIGLAQARREIARRELGVHEVAPRRARASRATRSASTISPRSRPSDAEAQQRPRPPPASTSAGGVHPRPPPRARASPVRDPASATRRTPGRRPRRRAAWPSRARRGTPRPRMTASTTSTNRSVAFTTAGVRRRRRRRAPRRSPPRASSAPARAAWRAQPRGDAHARVASRERRAASFASSASARAFSSSTNALRAGAPRTADRSRAARPACRRARRAAARSASSRRASGSPTSGGMR